MKGREICPYHPTGCSYNTTINADADLIITNHRLVSNFIKSDSSTEEEDSLPEDDFSDEEVKDGKSEKKKKKAPVINAENYFFDEAHHLMGYQSGEDVSDSVLTENIAMYLSTPLPYSADKKTVSAIVEKRDRLWTMWGELLYGIGRDIEKSCADSENTKGIGRIFGSDPPVILPKPDTSLNFSIRSRSTNFSLRYMKYWTASGSLRQTLQRTAEVSS